MTFPMPFIPPSINPIVTFLGAFSNSASGLSIGTARSDRIVVVAAQREDDTNTTCPLPTINGAAPSVVYQGSAPDNMCIGYSVVTTGTTVDIAGGQTRTAAWVITGVTTLDQTITNTGTGTAIDLTGTMPTKRGAIVGIARSRSNMGTSSATGSGTISGVVKDTSTTSGGGSSGWVAASGYTTSGSGTLSLSQTNSYSSGIAAAGVFK